MKKKIKKSQFIAALQEYADTEGFAYDPWDREMIWRGFVGNGIRDPENKYQDPNQGKTEQEIWYPVLKDYLDKEEDEEVEITVPA